MKDNHSRYDGRVKFNDSKAKTPFKRKINFNCHYCKMKGHTYENCLKRKKEETSNNTFLLEEEHDVFMIEEDNNISKSFLQPFPVCKRTSSLPLGDIKIASKINVHAALSRYMEESLPKLGYYPPLPLVEKFLKLSNHQERTITKISPEFPLEDEVEIPSFTNQMARFKNKKPKHQIVIEDYVPSKEPEASNVITTIVVNGI